MSVCSGSAIRAVSLVASAASNRQSSTFSACSENSAKFTPTPVQVAPRGYGSPGQTRIGRKRFKRRATAPGWELGAGGWELGAGGWELGAATRGLRTRGLESAH